MIQSRYLASISDLAGCCTVGARQEFVFFTTLQSLSSTRASLLEMRNIRAVQVNRQHDALCLRAPEVASVRRVADMRMVLLVVIEEDFCWRDGCTWRSGSDHKARLLYSNAAG